VSPIDVPGLSPGQTVTVRGIAAGHLMVEQPVQITGGPQQVRLTLPPMR
jgi:hypothetical protein